MRRLTFAAALAFASLTAFAQHDVGNPGDPVRLLVSEARDDARVLLVRVKPENLVVDPANPHAERIAAWYRANHARLDEALKNARLEWPPDLVMPHCALAKMHEMTVYFSYPTCRETVKGPVDALKLVLHEGTHLAGNPDEDIADGVALAVYETWLNSDANTTPRWDSLNPNDAPIERSGQASTFFEDEAGRAKLFVWGGCNEMDLVALECGTFVDDGAIYDLESKTWEKVAAPGSARAFATAVHTGKTGPHAHKILVFGGCNGPDHICRDDFASVLVFDLATRSWSAVDAPRAGEGPEGRFRHHAFWTGREMLVYGGIADVATAGRGRSLDDGWLFDPGTRAWTRLKQAGAPAARRFATAVLTGTEAAPLERKLIVYGGCDKQVGQFCPTYFRDGGIYDLGTGVWTRIDSGSFAGRAHHTAVWTGKEMFVWGGQSRNATLADGALFTLDGRWRIVSSLAGDPRYGASSAWAGDRVLVWGGQRRINEFSSGVKEFYLPTATTPFGQWLEPGVPAAPVGRWQHAAHWTGRALLVWGGQSEDRSYLNSGGLYVPRLEPR